MTSPNSHCMVAFPRPPWLHMALGVDGYTFAVGHGDFEASDGHDDQPIPVPVTARALGLAKPHKVAFPNHAESPTR